MPHKVDQPQKFPGGAFRAEFEKTLTPGYPDTKFSVRRAGKDAMTVLGGSPHDGEVIEMMFQETWESGDDWFKPA